METYLIVSHIILTYKLLSVDKNVLSILMIPRHSLQTIGQHSWQPFAQHQLQNDTIITTQGQFRRGDSDSPGEEN